MIEWPGLEDYKVGATHKVVVPTFINVSKLQVKALNLNVYRNLHHHHLNTQKQNFHAEVKSKLADLPYMEQIAVHYEIWVPRNNRVDTMNVGSITDKYFSDTLVEAKKIMDDNYNHIVATSFSFGGVDPMNGHANITIYEIERELPMRVLLDDNDIQTALEDYVEKQGIAGATGVSITVQGSNIEAEVEFGDQPAPDPKPKTTRKKPAPRKTKAKVEETADAETDTTDSSTGSDQDGTSGDQTDTPEEETATAEGSNQKTNPFAEKGSESSDSAKTEETKVQSDPEPVVEKASGKAKKTSIFDM